MTLIECGVLSLWAVLAVVGWMVGSRYWGNGGAVVGATLGLVVPALVRLLLSAVWRATSGNRPLFPNCRHGRCGPRQYRILGQGRRVSFQCECGDTYAHGPRTRGKVRFMWIKEDGTAIPYMCHTTWGPWKPDPEAETPAPEVPGGPDDGGRSGTTDP